MNGQQAAEDNLLRFQNWAAGKTDADFRTLARGGKLSRHDIVKECGFARSVLAQNPRVKSALTDLEALLRESGILSEQAGRRPGEDGVDEPEPLRQFGQADGIAAQVRLRALEQRVQLLLAENTKLRERLASYSHIENVLATTGRLVR